MNPGDYVLWHYVQTRGGYGYSQTVPAQVVKVNNRSIRIAAVTRTGAIKEVNVQAKNLRPYTREQYEAALAKAGVK